jgi:hypothetical protein
VKSFKKQAQEKKQKGCFKFRAKLKEKKCIKISASTYLKWRWLGKSYKYCQVRKDPIYICVRLFAKIPALAAVALLALAPWAARQPMGKSLLGKSVLTCFHQLLFN